MSGQLPLPFAHRPSLTGEDFLVAPCNAEAVAWIDRWPDWPHAALALAGPPGAGKTHLAAVWAQRAGARGIDHRVLAAGDPAAVPGEGPFILDGADSLMGDDGAERALFHILNRLQGRPGRLLLTGALPPARWAVRLADLRSRLGAIPVAVIGLPDDATVEALLIKQFADRQVALQPAALRYIVARIERSFEEVRRLVAALDERALALGRPVTVPLVREVMEKRGKSGDGGGAGA